jgi:hypothetical protein
LHEVSQLNLQSRLVLKLLAILADYIGTASQTARWISGSATGLEIASDVACIVDAEIKLGIILISLLSLGMKCTQKGCQLQKKKYATDFQSLGSSCHETPARAEFTSIHLRTCFIIPF